MADPQRKPTNSPNLRPDLRAIDGGGDSTPDRANLRAVEASRDLENRENSNVTQGPWGGDPQADDASAVRDAEEGGSADPRTIRDGESNYGGWKATFGKKLTKSNITAIRKKRGIAGLVVTILLGGGFAGLTLLTPAGLFIQLGNVFTNAFDDSSSPLSIRTNKVLQLKMDGLRNSFDQSSEGKCGIKCKMGTVGETMKNNLESPSNGFKAEFSDKKFGNRYTIKSITFPDGTVTTSGAEFDKAMKEPTKARDFNKVFNSKIKFFLNGSPFALSLQKKLGVNRLPKVSGTTKEEIDTSLRKAVGATGESAAADGNKTNETNRAAVGDKINTKFNGRINIASNFIGVACLAYDVTRVSVAVTKLTKYAAYASFALSFLAVKDQIMAGDADQAVVSHLGKQLTDGSSATDAPIYKQAADGDVIKNDTGFSIQPSGAMVAALAGIGGVIGVNAAARNSANVMCKANATPGSQAAQTLVACLPEIAAGFAVAGFGSIVAAVGCIGVNVIGGVAIGAAIGASLPLIFDAIAKGDLITPDETTRGKPAGQVIGIAAELMMNGKSQTYGLKAATSKEQIVAFNDATLEDKNMQNAIAKLDASEDPLNVNNEFTFVGSLVKKLEISRYKSASLMGALSHTLGLVPLSLSSVSSTIYAESGYPLGYDKSTVFKTGNDASLDGIGALSDDNGLPTYVMSPAELKMDIYSAIDSLTSTNDMNTDGVAVAGSDLAKYTEYCGVNRVDPLGETTSSISEDDYEWRIGAKCLEESEKMSAIRVYTMDSGINDTIEQKYVSTATENDSATGTAVLPVDPGYVINSPFGYRKSPCAGCSTEHPAVDFSEYAGGSLGRPVYSIMAGEVVSFANDGGNNAVSIKHANGTVSQYLHMYTNDIMVHVGDKVTAGQQIGKIGSSGDSTGPHLDLRIYIDNVDLAKETAIAALASDPVNIITRSGHHYINPVPYMALYGVIL